MMSIENFYWILYDNLLKPSNIDGWYYYPFGTTNNLSREFQPCYPKREHHVLFHYDQEPLYDQTLGLLYDSSQITWSSKIVRILANSEKSLIAKNICQSRGMLSWYFFYHGFAAMNWFRDSQFIIDESEVKNVFLSLNHLVKNRRSYRINLLARLIGAGVLNHGSVGFHADQKDCLDEICDKNTQLSVQSRHLITKNIPNIQLPMQVDRHGIDGNASAHFGHQEYKLWQGSFLHLVNETVFYEPKLHLTEKTFKPIVSLRPFILVASPGNLSYLKSYGFKTFNQWWDESYDEIPDPDNRLDAISRIIVDLCNRPFREIKEILEDMRPILEHNKKHFFGDFRKIIVDELVDNFDTCIRIWNNGRVDGRNLPLHPNIESVKQILLQ